MHTWRKQHITVFIKLQNWSHEQDAKFAYRVWQCVLVQCISSEDVDSLYMTKKAHFKAPVFQHRYTVERRSLNLLNASIEQRNNELRQQAAAWSKARLYQKYSKSTQLLVLWIESQNNLLINLQWKDTKKKKFSPHKYEDLKGFKDMATY